MNGDRKMDLIFRCAERRGNSDLSTLLGTGDGTFVAPKLTAIFDGDDTNGFAVGDFNGDGKMDISVTNFTNSFSGIYLGNGDGTLMTSTDSYGDIVPDESIPLNA